MALLPESTTASNRRVRRMRELEAEGYFAPDAIRQRDPLLFHQHVGRFSEARMGQLSGAIGGPDGAHSFSGYLVGVVNRRRIEDKFDADLAAEVEAFGAEGRRAAAAMDDAADEEGDTETHEDGGGGDGDGDDEPRYNEHSRVTDGQVRVPHVLEPRPSGAFNDADLEQLEQELVREMRRSFLEGRDAGIDYAAIDADPRLDDIAQENQDAQDAWFDQD